MIRLLLSCLLIGLVAAGLPAGVASASPGAGEGVESVSYGSTSSFCADSAELEVLRLINDYRARNGLGALALTKTLSGAAEHHSASMGINGYFSHDLIPEGITWSQNMTNHGYGYDVWKGENIAAGNDTPYETFMQ